MADRIQLRRDTKANWEAYNPILLEGEPGHVLDDPNLYKMGDGIHNWNDLPYRGYNGTVVQEVQAGVTNAVPSSNAVASALIPYISKLSITNVITFQQLKNFILDFKILEDRVEGYDYGILHVNNGLPENSGYAYYFGIYRWPTGQTPTYGTGGNVIEVDAFFLGNYKPANGIIKGEHAELLVNWDAVADSTWGGSSLFGLFKNDCKFNQDYIFDLNVGPIAEHENLIKSENDLKNDLNKNVALVANDDSYTVLDAKNGQDYSNASREKNGRNGVASCIFDCKGVSFNQVLVPFLSESANSVVSLKIGQTDSSQYDDNSNNLFQDALLNNLLVTKDTTLQLGVGYYTTVTLDNVITVTKKNLVIAVETKSVSTYLHQVYQNNRTSAMRKTNSLKINDRWYIYSGSDNAMAYGVYPILRLQNKLATNEYVDSLIVPYISKLSINSSITKRQLKDFISDFKVLEDRVEGYDYGIWDVNNGLPAGVDYAYYLCIYRWPTGEKPYFNGVKNTNLISVTSFSLGSTKPANGLLKNSKAAVMVNWDAVADSPFGGSWVFDLFTPDNVFNQDYIFDKNTGIASSQADISELRADINRLDDEVSDLNDKSDTEIDVVLPNKIYAVVGDTLQLFHRGIVKVPCPQAYDIQVYCPKGKDYPRYFEYTPGVSDVGVTELTVYVRNANRVILGQKTCVLQTVNILNSPSTSKKVLCFGDSLTSSGDWCAEAYRRLVKSGGSPAGKELSNIDFCGSMTKNDAGYFGVGGWTWNSYIAKSGNYYRFQVSGVDTLSYNAVYTNNGNTFTIKEINVTNGSGNILCQVSSLSPAPSASGTLTKQSGNGDSTITFSSYSVDDANPLWDSVNNKMSFIPYADEVSDGKINVVYVLLGWNQVAPAQTDFSALLNQVKTFADTLHSEFPMAKLKLMGLQVNSLNGGCGANYGAVGGWSDEYGIAVTVLNLNKAYQAFANQEGYSNFVEFIDISAQFDTDYNMPSGAKAVNTRNSETEVVGTNGVHPSINGYYQIADAVYRNVIKELCQ